MAYQLYLNDVLFPVVPPKIETTINGKNETATLINEGEVSVLKKQGLTDITIDSLLLPSHDYPFVTKDDLGVSAFNEPKYFLDYLETWMTSKEPVQFKLIRVKPNGAEVDWYNNMMVSVENYSIIEDAEEYGDDICVSLELKQWVAWGAKKLKVTKKKVTKKKTRKNTKKTYYKIKVKKGDTLIKIAKRYTPKKTYSKKIYSLNKKTIENAAKKHGRKSSSKGKYLYSGTVLKLNKTWLGGGGSFNSGTATGGGGK